MDYSMFYEFFKKSPVAYSLQKVVFDVKGVPIDYEVIELNQSYELMMNHKAETILNKKYSQLSEYGYNDTLFLWIAAYQEAVTTNQDVMVDWYHKIIHKWLRIHIIPIEREYFACVFFENTENTILGQGTEAFFHMNLDMLCIIDKDGRFTYANSRFHQMLGYDLGDLEGKYIYDYVHQEDVQETKSKFMDVGNSDITLVIANRYRCKDGTYRYLEWHCQGHQEFLYASARDITQHKMVEEELRKSINERKGIEKDILYLSYHDQLTRIYNRYFMEKKVNEEMKHADRYNEPLSMAILDLDHFKRVNDTWGHPVGDDVLCHIADLVTEHIRESDIFARIGGEEFALLMPATDMEGAYTVSEKIRCVIEEDVHPIIGKITVSIGVGERLKSESYIKWYKRVDAALYRAKDAGRNKVIKSEDLASLPAASVEVKWKSEWSSGDGIIDEQHQELIRLGNQLIFMSLAGDTSENIKNQLDSLLDHIVKHFALEEKIQSEIGYPHQLLHAKSHQKLIHRAENLKQQYLNGVIKATAFFSFLVDDVIMGHLLDEDIKFFPYIKNKK